MDPSSRGVKRQNGNKSLPYKTYLPKGLTQNNHGFQCSLAQIKNFYPLSGLFRKKTVKTLYGWISCLALTAPTIMVNKLRAAACPMSARARAVRKSQYQCNSLAWLTGDGRLKFLRNSARRLKMRERIERAG